MRATFTCLAFAAMSLAANAQFSITPKAGIEPSITTIDYNNRSLSPLGVKISPQIGLRMDYKFKKAHGPYVGLSTNRSVVEFRFTDPESGMNNYTATAGKLQMRIEGGYQFSTKPINLGSQSAKKSQAVQTAPPATQAKQGCHKSRSSCGNKNKADKMKPAINKAWNVRIQPAAGLALNPFTTGARIDKNMNGAGYQLNAGSWKTALTTGVDFEFGRGRQRMFTVGFQYLKGLGNMGDATIVTQAGTKSTTTYLSSKASAWNVTIGVPFTLSKNRSSHHRDRHIQKIREEKKQCIYYRPCRRA